MIALKCNITCFSTLFHAEKPRHSSAAPACLTRLSTRMMEAIHDWLVVLRLALIRPIPSRFLACPDLPSIGFRSPGLTWSATAFAEGLPSGFAASLMFRSLSHLRCSRLQYKLSVSTLAG